MRETSSKASVRNAPAGGRKTSAKHKAHPAQKTVKAVEEVRTVLQQTLAKRKHGKKYKLTAADRKALKKALQDLRDRVVDEITFLAGDNLNRSQRESSGDLSSYSIHMADQGTDNFDREFALNLVSSEQDILYEIDEALQRLEAGTYGTCEVCSDPIEKPRLEALPFAKLCVKCQAATERGRTRYRPFGPTIVQG
ncbi:MAG: TraR/DksA C4-type zinc finger protein [Kiritimatiellae bacterium]|nr:TraR/DksA C4-type zinc finger protein [Kiritimatiellia bacterium]